MSALLYRRGDSIRDAMSVMPELRLCKLWSYEKKGVSLFGKELLRPAHLRKEKGIV